MRLFSDVWSENAALFERLMETHLNPPILWLQPFMITQEAVLSLTGVLCPVFGHSGKWDARPLWSTTTQRRSARTSTSVTASTLTNCPGREYWTFTNKRYMYIKLLFVAINVWRNIYCLVCKADANKYLVVAVVRTCL